MKFGKNYNEEDEAGTGGGGGDYLRYFKGETTTFRILQEPDDWIDYWEHFNPGGYSFPCTRDRNSCPGCTSSNEKMKKASKKIAINVLEGEYVNAYKIPKTVADKLSTRASRIGTVTDRDYTIYKIQTKNADGSTKTDYDVEGGDKIPVDIATLQPKFRDIEEILTSMYDQSWGDPDKTMQSNDNAEQTQAQQTLKEKLAAQQATTDERIKEDRPEPEWASGEKKEDPNKVWTEAELRTLPFSEILIVCSKEGMEVPEDLATSEDTNKVVDWLLDQ